MTAGGMVSLIPDFRTDGRAMIKPLQRDEHPKPDSDCESGPEQANGSAPEEQVYGKGELERESVPILTVGSFARYAQHPVLVELELLNLSVAGDHCSSICVRTRYSSHPSNPKAPICVCNTCKDRRHQTSLLPVHLKQSIPSHPR
jgi:hypothetical protein